MSLAVDQMARSAMDEHRAGRLDEAERLCRLALSESPEHFPSIVHISVLLRNKGEFPEAIAMAERAIALRPHEADGYIQLALSLLGAGRPGEAVAPFRSALRLSPNLAPVHYHYGLALENIGHGEEAKAAFVRATSLDPADVRPRISLGSLFLTEEDIVGARVQAESAVKANRNSAEAHQLMAKVFVAEEKGSKAEESIRHSLELDPNSSYGHSMLGFRLLRTGDFEGAEQSFMRSIGLDPAQGVAYYGLSQARKIRETDRPLINQMLDVLHNVPLTLEQASYLEFGLGKALDNLGEYEQAMLHFDGAHRSAHLLRYRDNHFDELEFSQGIEATKRLYSKDLIQAGGDSLATDLPIFVVGMMRSGTTLTEQILSCHPRIGAAGEQWFWPQRSYMVEDFKQMRLNRRQAVTLARDYCKELRKVSPGTERVTDKLPGNYLRLGLLTMAMPNAKFIHCKRNPVDTSLSIYFTANPVAPAFTHTKEGIAFVYRSYLNLMEYWRSVLPPGRLYEVQYEELVADPEPVIRGMLEFLGIEWDSACLSHHMNVKEVRTPSLWQVRQPMYSTSVQRWRRYEPWLGALHGLLDLPESNLPT